MTLIDFKYFKNLKIILGVKYDFKIHEIVKKIKALDEVF